MGFSKPLALWTAIICYVEQTHVDIRVDTLEAVRDFQLINMTVADDLRQAFVTENDMKTEPGKSIDSSARSDGPCPRPVHAPAPLHSAVLPNESIEGGVEGLQLQAEASGSSAHSPMNQ